MKRRQFIRRSIIAAGSLGLLSGIYSWRVEPYWLEFVYRKMPIANLPAGLYGKTLMQISDLHVGNYFDYTYLIESFREAQELEPDIVVYTGDFITHQNDKQFEQLGNVLEYVVRGKLGTLAILGNHDYGRQWSDPEIAKRVAAVLKSYKVTLLRNEYYSISGLRFIGLDDYWGTNFDGAAITKWYRSGQPTIVLCHNPDVCDQDIWGRFEGWILSGHTHGGQFNTPLIGHPFLPVENKNYTCGEFELDERRRLYINRALGSTIPLRMNVRPEITVFELG